MVIFLQLFMVGQHIFDWLSYTLVPILKKCLLISSGTVERKADTLSTATFFACAFKFCNYSSKFVDYFVLNATLQSK